MIGGMQPTASASIHIAASASRVYHLIADLPSMGRWSPECIRCDWIGGATRAVPGARFKGRNRLGWRGWRRWSTNGEVVVADLGRELTFDISSILSFPVARWSYVIDPTDGGVIVTESSVSRGNLLLRAIGWIVTGVGKADRPEHNRRGIEATLARLKASAELP